MKTSYILKNQLLHGNRVMGYVTDYTTEIDTLDDFEFIEWQTKKNNQLIKKLFEG